MVQTIESAGGPLICIEQDALNLWHGVTGQGVAASTLENADFPNDYELACSIDGYLGKLRLNQREALVLGDEPLSFFNWQPAGQLPTLVGIYYCDEFDEIPELLPPLQSLFLISPIDSLHITFHTPRICIFDSAWPGSDCLQKQSSFMIDVPPGHYIVETRVMQPDANTSLLLHTFVSSPHSAVDLG